ncbi:MAG: BON domain-containing protein [Phycisphaerales bacterium]
MNPLPYIAAIALASLLFCSACEQRNDPSPAPDNTAKNKAERAGDTKTPMDQSESSADIKVTAAIRRAVMDDKSMSMNAQNCKIITDKSGLVTLRGVVNSQTEKDSIEAKAKAVEGVTRVDNQLEVKSS